MGIIGGSDVSRLTDRWGFPGPHPPPKEFRVITRQADFHALLARLRGQPELAIDCEFEGERRYYEELCLLQIAAGTEVVAVDPFSIDLAPFGEILADASVTKVFHAGANDLPLLARATGQPVRNVFDTQIAAAFVGYTRPPALNLLVERLCGVSLPKTSQYTNWTNRPLSEEQVAYALNDVRYLPAVAAALRKELVQRDRLLWAAMEMEEMVARALAPRDLSRIILKLGPFTGMSPRHMAVLHAVASWREQLAEETNRARKSVATDEALLQMAFRPPKTAEDVRQVRGLGRIEKGVGGLLAAVNRALSLPEAECPPVPVFRPPDERAEVASLVLDVALQIRANELGIGDKVIATREQLKALASWHFAGRPEPPPETEILGGWRRSAAGEMLLSFLDGSHSLTIDSGAPDGVRLAPVPSDSKT
jgi:ribonuclease D